MVLKTTTCGLPSLGAWHTEAHTGRLKRVHLYVERGSGEIGFLSQVPEHATGWINGTASPLHHSQAAIEATGGQVVLE